MTVEVFHSNHLTGYLSKPFKACWDINLNQWVINLKIDNLTDHNTGNSVPCSLLEQCVGSFTSRRIVNCLWISEVLSSGTGRTRISVQRWRIASWLHSLSWKLCALLLLLTPLAMEITGNQWLTARWVGHPFCYTSRADDSQVTSIF